MKKEDIVINTAAEHTPEEKLPWRKDKSHVTQTDFRKRMHAALDRLLDMRKKSKDKDPCWKGYEQFGTKMKGGKEVPNCIPEKDSLISGAKHSLSGVGRTIAKAAIKHAADKKR